MLNWTYFAPRLTLAGLLWAFLAFAVDPLLCRGVRSSLAAAGGDVTTVRTACFPPRLEVTGGFLADGLDAGNGHDLAAFDRLTCDLDGCELLHGRFLVDEATLTGVRFDAPARGDRPGELPPLFPDWSVFDDADPAGRAADDVVDDGNGAGLGEFVGSLVDDLAAVADPRALETVRLAERLRGGWRVRFAELEGRSKELERGVRAVRDRVRGAGGVAAGDPLRQAREYAASVERVRALLAEIQSLKEEMPALAARARADLTELNAAKERDLAEARRVVRMRDLDPGLVARDLLGRELSMTLDTVLGYAGWLRGTLHRGRFPDPTRSRGETVLFPALVERPRLHVRRMTVAGELPAGGRVVPFTGTVTGLTDDPALLGEPAVTRLAGGRDGLTFQATLTHDRTRTPAADALAVTVVTADDGPKRLADLGGVAVSVAAAETVWEARFALTGEGELSATAVDGTLRVRRRPAVLDVVDTRGAAGLGGGVRAAAVSLLSGAVKEVRELEATLAVAGPLRKPRVRLDTDLGERLAGGLKRTGGTLLAGKRAELLAFVDAETARQTASVTDELGRRWGAVTAQLTEREQAVRLAAREAVDAKNRRLTAKVAGLAERAGLDGPPADGVTPAALQERANGKVDAELRRTAGKLDGWLRRKR